VYNIIYIMLDKKQKAEKAQKDKATIEKFLGLDKETKDKQEQKKKNDGKKDKSKKVVKR